ncbi:hypothetical protein KGA66_06065 [Actinocrinis puniceicyclus]|uniref:Uncharacterized protein n=1 Tax=Actinocrinis puniceicyclus TaxID=977794 RepID=A0A8J8BDA6_9ACTN|nr:hypothetical protein [Actinocrinis puniceicyclus]MBS2962604.1 hypothetical protein [Actinocrinis puniceicyclus]
MPDKHTRTATVTPLPTMMPGAPPRPALKQAPPAPEASHARAQQLTAAQSIRHLATQHALTFNRDEDLTIEELLADAAAIERYITDGTRDEPEPGPDAE